jgi:CheY-like chemotaxis protein
VGKGTGLGLSVVHGIVLNCGGAITVSSEPGSGATFDVYLPLLDREAYQAGVHEAAKLPQEGKGSILFVDDEDHICRTGKQMLESLGYRVTAETSSLRALALFSARADAFNLVVTDLSMPDMGGLLLVEKIFALRPQMPVILTTGYSEAMTLERAQQAGIADLLMKPYNKTDLSVSISHVLLL